MRGTHSAAQSVSRLRHRDQVDMVGHQAVGPDLDAAAIAPLAHQADVGLMILVGEKRAQTAVAPLRQVMREPGSHYARQPRHAGSLDRSVPSVKQTIA